MKICFGNKKAVDRWPRCPQAWIDVDEWSEAAVLEFELQLVFQQPEG